MDDALKARPIVDTYHADRQSVVSSDFHLDRVRFVFERVFPDKVVEFRLIITRSDREGVDTLDIAAWSAKSRKSALSLKADEWIEISGSVHRRFWQAPTGLASRWQVEAVEISRL